MGMRCGPSSLQPKADRNERYVGVKTARCKRPHFVAARYLDWVGKHTGLRAKNKHYKWPLRIETIFVADHMTPTSVTPAICQVIHKPAGNAAAVFYETPNMLNGLNSAK
jgi:hypothetical protein